MTVADPAANAWVADMAQAGVTLRVPPIVVRVRSSLHAFARQLHSLYRDYVRLPAATYADVDIRIVRSPGAFYRSDPECQFVVDGTTPFDPFPASHALPIFEWGLNWIFAQRMHNFLLLHAAVVERAGRALILPAWPGAGKSTLAASLTRRGWRFLSDEFCAIADEARTVVPFARPAALKNESIAVMRSFAPDAFLGPEIPGTRKGTVAHLRVPAEDVRTGDVPARVANVVFPDFRAGAAVDVAPLGPASAFLKLASNAFNYEIVGEVGFRRVAAIIRACPCHVLRYGDLAAAHEILDTLAAVGDR